jgi:hypothetical protein
MWRVFYEYLGWDYVGRREQAMIDKQKRLKYLQCEQVKKSNIKLKKIPEGNLFITSILKKRIMRKNR